MNANHAAARAGLYRLIALAFDYPHQEFLDALRSGEYQEALAASVQALGLPLASLPTINHDCRDIEATYLATFELGRDGGSPCRLNEGAYVDFEQDILLPEGNTGQAALLEDLLRFYHYFGLRLTDDPMYRLPPDHLVCQFEMLSHLSLVESKDGTDEANASGYRAAQRDFLRRHVMVWLPRFIDVLKEAGGNDVLRGFYAEVAQVASTCAAAHLKCVS